jgi:polyhydroxyalkanoate synthesis regulator phasin
MFMNMKKTLAVLSVGVLAIAVVFGVFAYRTANAQVTTPDEPAGNTPLGQEFIQTEPPEGGPAELGPGRPGFGKGPKGVYNNEDLANALGITVDELNAAQQEAYQAALDQAVQAGLITQAQADDLAAKGSAFPFGGRWGGWLEQKGIDYETLLADALGITVDELQAAYAQAFNARIDQAVSNGNLSQEQADLIKGEYALRTSENFRSAMQSAFESAVSQAVSEGVITQAQADLILERRNNMGFGGFDGPLGGGFGRHGGWIGGAPDEQAAPAITP